MRTIIGKIICFNMRLSIIGLGIFKLDWLGWKVKIAERLRGQITDNHHL